MSVAFVRQLGSQPGIQLNPLQDNSDGFAQDNADQRFGIALRAKRGRIDRCFKVNRGNVLAKLGTGDSIRSDQLNEALVQTYEALGNGAFEAVVHRLTTSAAALNYIVLVDGPIRTASNISAASSDKSFNRSAGSFVADGFKMGQTITTTGFATSANNGSFVITAVTAGKITIGGSDGNVIVTEATGASVTITAASGPGAKDIIFSVQGSLPPAYILAVRHLGCFNDGIKVSIHANTKMSGGSPVPNNVVRLKVKAPNGDTLFDLSGSLDPLAVDDFGASIFLPDVAERSSVNPELVVRVNTSSAQTIKTTSNAYGRTGGRDQYANSDTLIYFTEGGTGYSQADYDLAAERLTETEFDYAYIASGGTQSVALISTLAQLAFDTNRLVRFDVPVIDSNLTPAAAIAFVASLGIDSYYCSAFWHPVKCNDPLNGGKAFLGTSTLNIAKACLRNANRNAEGFAPKNAPIAGKEHAIGRTGMEQQYTPDQFELSDLADAKINPVIYQRYNGGGRFVFTDSLTMALTEVSLRKLISVADMSSSIDDVVTRFGKEVLQLPMTTAIVRMSKFLKKLFESAEAAQWIIPSDDLDGKSFQFSVVRSDVRPADQMIVNYSLRYDGVVRQIFITQTLSR